MTTTLSPLDQKIDQHFGGLVVRKDLVKAVKGNAIVPSYVLEYLLGQYCATSDEASIQSGIETVKEILAKHYVHRSQAGLVRSTIKEKGRYKVIDKVSVELNESKDIYEATFSNLGINKVFVTSDTVKQHKKLLVGGVWCIADIEYQFSEERDVPWVLETLKPIQLSSFDFDQYVNARAEFSTEEWIDTLLQSIGFSPEVFGQRSKLLQLVRLIPFCERNYNLIELGPKGTGKSHIYSEFSPHGMLISGGEITVPKLFVNNSTGNLGLVGYWDCVAFDEFAGRKKRVDNALVDIMKNYMANKSFSRGVETLGAEASMAFVGNTKHSVPYMLRNSDLFEELPVKYHDSAFLDRLHFFIPGWEVDIIRNEMFTSGFGFVVDYLAEVLKSMRDMDLSNEFEKHFELSDQISTRDRDAIRKTFSGLMKIVFPNKGATEEETKWLLKFAIEGRKRVKDQLLRIDETFTAVNFAFTDKEGKETVVKTLEEGLYPDIYYDGGAKAGEGGDASEDQSTEIPSPVAAASGTPSPAPPVENPEEGHKEIFENQTGISYDNLFAAHLKGAKKIVITDPYIRKFHQARNLSELLETISKIKTDENIDVELITVADDLKPDEQTDFLNQIRIHCHSIGIMFAYKFEEPSSVHARHIVTDHGWKITLDRGLDVFQHYDSRDAFSFSTRLQEHRKCKPFEVTYIKQS